ncbi:nucleotidyl transferase AbiEii/AbiGii toxin family protein [Cupriavidus necator]|uniref:nucleotidyl transferase AbiEii/AbiGii toxin family protein n=1 Tax=Cupriavidus necator TaxID=106590 RepID=UPI003ECDE15D
MLKADLTRPGTWTSLFPKALALMQHLESETHNPPWTFGGGTVLMLRINHRQSKDIDLFVPDPQYLGYVNPRLSDAAEAITTDYEENAEYLKLLLPTGEIDIVVGTALTDRPFELVEYAGRPIRVETNAEIVAKKMWHRGDRAKARDLFDLCAVAKADPEAIAMAAPFMERHGEKFLEVLGAREDFLRRDFEAIDALDFHDSFDQCAELGRRIIGHALGRQPADGLATEGLYVGPILEAEDGIAVQRINSRGDVVRHSSASLTKPVAVGELVEINYRAGIGRVTGQGLKRELSQGR